MIKQVYPGLTSYQRVAAALVYASLISVALFVGRAFVSQNLRYWFLLWNLCLAWLPLLFSGLLVYRLRSSRWLEWKNIVLTALWLGFLPNSFYLVSDLIHLRDTGEVSHLYDSVLFASLIFNGFILGLLSILGVHYELLKRFHRQKVHAVIAGVLFLCGFAIYLGRSLRWNTWDVLVNPFGILFDVSERVINPISHDQVFVTTGIFFLLLSGIYAVTWQLSEAFRDASKS